MIYLKLMLGLGLIAGVMSTVGCSENDKIKVPKEYKLAKYTNMVEKEEFLAINDRIKEIITNCSDDEILYNESSLNITKIYRDKILKNDKGKEKLIILEQGKSTSIKSKEILYDKENSRMSISGETKSIVTNKGSGKKRNSEEIEKEAYKLQKNNALTTIYDELKHTKKENSTTSFESIMSEYIELFTNTNVDKATELYVDNNIYTMVFDLDDSLLVNQYKLTDKSIFITYNSLSEDNGDTNIISHAFGKSFIEFKNVNVSKADDSLYS